MRMTIEEVQIELELAGKPNSRGQVYNYLRKLDIAPVGTLEQKPQQYPDDTAKRILVALGVKPAKPIRAASVKRKVVA